MAVEKPKRRKTVITVNPPSRDEPSDPPSTQNATSGGGASGGNGNDPLPSSQLPPYPAILWSPEPHPRTSTTSDTPSLDLPPSEIFQDALDNLHVAFHPKTQHRATYAPQDASAGSVVEPTLALYCPIEGGDYVIDETVRELASHVGADIVVLDCVQLAAGSAGLYGPGAPSPPRFPSF